MEKLDVVVAVVGGLILVAATVGAGLSATDEAARTFAFTFSTTKDDLGSEAVDQTGLTSDTRFSFEVTQANVTRLIVIARVSYTPGAATASAHAILTAPDGNATEADLACGGGACETTFERLVGEAPEDFTAPAADDAEARARLDALNGTAGQGEWTLDVSFASGAPPTVTHNAGYTARLERYEGEVAPLLPASR